jgi:ribonuclease HI
MKVTAQTDGAYSGNPGLGGWAFALTFGARTLERSGQIAQTTNNAAELTAVLEAVRAIRKP